MKQEVGKEYMCICIHFKRTYIDVGFYTFSKIRYKLIHFDFSFKVCVSAFFSDANGHPVKMSFSRLCKRTNLFTYLENLQHSYPESR